MKLKQLYEADLNWATRDNAQRPGNFDDKNYVLLMVNIKDTFDNGHSGFKLDVEDEKGGPNAIGDRLTKAKAHFEQGKPMDYPEVAYNLSTKTVDYTNGRHRAVAAYQMGKWFIPMFVSKDGLHKFKEVVRTLPI
jgi:hypothetical protein